MSTISEEAVVKTYINVFHCAPENQRALSDMIRKETEDAVRHLPGFVSANVHLSADGQRVTNYAQWTDLAAFGQHMRSDAGRAMVRQADALADNVDVQIYDVDWIVRAPRADHRGARALWEAAWSAVDAADEDALRQLCDDDIEISTPSNQHRGAQKLVDLFAQQRGLYADLQHRVDSVIESADGTALAAELTLSGVPNGTDKRLTWRVVETIRSDAGRLVYWHALLDRTWLVHQIRANQH